MVKIVIITLLTLTQFFLKKKIETKMFKKIFFLSAKCLTRGAGDKLSVICPINFKDPCIHYRKVLAIEGDNN